MSHAFERISVTVTTKEKKRIANLARQAGMSTGEFMRRAATAFAPEKDGAALSQLVEHVERSTAAASASIDDAVQYVEASNIRIAAMEAARNRAT